MGADMTQQVWISVQDRLPEDKRRVLIMTDRTNVRGWNGELVQMHVATFVRGRTAAEVERSGFMCGYDQSGNNLVPYAWDGDGPMRWFGQDVTHWMPLPIPPEKERT